MSRLRRWSVVCFFLVIAVGFTPADGQPPPAAKADEIKWSLDRAISITPRAEPQPALKYRLLPLAPELKEGNAVPIYLRLNQGQDDAARKYWLETPQPWNDLPLDQVPLAEAHKYLDVVGKMLSQIDIGARRKRADWNYTIDQPDPISMLLPDLQQMRNFSPALVTRLRVQIAEGDYVGAARSFETGFAFARHVAQEGPFVIGGLVGIAIANFHVARIPEWIERPDSPNLYWSLTALPRPLISLRWQLEFEQRIMELQFPDLADLDRARSAGEWDTALKRFRTEARRIDPLVNNEISGIKPENRQPPPPDPDEPATKAPDLAVAQKYVAERSRKSEAVVAAMPPAQVMMLYIAGTYADLRDEVFKLTYLPYPQARPLLRKAAEQLKKATGGEGVRFAKLFLPEVTNIMASQVRLERNVAMLRVVEALRMHAAAHGGELPDSLDQVTVVPVPLDPGTDKPFEYNRDGATATLVSQLPGEPRTPGLRYRLTVRK